MWVIENEPTETGWYLANTNGCKIPLWWNNDKKKFSGMVDDSYRIDEIESWLDDSAIPPPPEWRNLPYHLPLCGETGEWDGKRSGLVIAKTDYKRITKARLYEGMIDGYRFFQWYSVDSVSGAESEIYNVIQWREI